MASRLYVMCDEHACDRAGWTLLDFADACLAGGARLLQLRVKTASSCTFLETADALVRRAAMTGARVIVNDRADIARLSRAAGVHVGQDDLAPAAVRALLGPAAVVGVSTHSAGQVEAAVSAPITYLAIGPVFSTTTKETGYDAVGLGGVRAAATVAGRHGLAVVGIGGVTLERARAVIDAGADAVAVVGDLFVTRDPAGRVRAFLDALDDGRSPGGPAGNGTRRAWHSGPAGVE